MRGELSEFTLAELLQLFALSERTGTILITTSSSSSRILLESGRVVGIGLEEFNVHSELMACEFLPARSGVSLDSITPSPSTPGLSFIVRNLVEPERWDLFSRRCLEQEIYPLLGLEQGCVEIAVERVPFSPLAVTVSVQQLILDGSRWEAEMGEYRAAGFGRSTSWVRADGVPGPETISSVEWLIWSVLKESQTIASAARRVCVPDLDATAAIRKLSSTGLVKVAG